MTFLLKTEREATNDIDERELSFLCKTQPRLDELCEALGVDAIRSFVDEEEAGAELARLFPELSLEASSGSQWADVGAGARTFQMLLETLLGNRESVVPFLREHAKSFTPDHLAMLIEELEFVLALLEDVGGGRFCLTLVS